MNEKKKRLIVLEGNQVKLKYSEMLVFFFKYSVFEKIKCWWEREYVQKKTLKMQEEIPERLFSKKGIKILASQARGPEFESPGPM